MEDKEMYEVIAILIVKLQWKVLDIDDYDEEVYQYLERALEAIDDVLTSED